MINTVTIGIFIVEAILKIIASGFLLNYKGSYLRNGWNILDFFVTSISLMDLIFFAEDMSTQFTFLQSLRVVRALKPLRFVGKNKGLRLATESLLSALPTIIKMQFMISIIMLILAILQTNVYEGQFSYCYTDHLQLSLRQRLKSIKTKFDCLNYGGEWFTPDLNYDTVGQSILTLFVLQSTEGWIGTMWSSADAVDVDYEPI